MRLHPTHPPPAGKEHSIEKVSPWSCGRSQPLRAPETFPAPRELQLTYMIDIALTAEFMISLAVCDD